MNEIEAHSLPEPARLMFKYAVNPVMRFVLTSPLHVLTNRFLMLLEYTGRKSGNAYRVPLAFDWEGERGIRLFTDSAWVKNLRVLSPVRVAVRGKWKNAQVAEVSADAKTVAERIQDVVTRRGRWYASRFRLGKGVDMSNGYLIAERVVGMTTVLLHIDASDE